MVNTKKNYKELSTLLSRKFSLDQERIVFDEIDQEIQIHEFHSRAHDDLPDESAHIKKNPAFLALLKYYLSRNTASDREIFHTLKTPDREIPENTHFKYPVLKPLDQNESSKVIILLHGLNERSWDKYLPWASLLSRETGAAVLLFPMAFHMNRSPGAWGDIRKMMPVSRERHALLPDLRASSFANAALSYRIQFAPQRFVLSGVQTFLDLVNLMKVIKEGNFPGLSPNGGINFFSYSIGATLTEVLMMANPQGLTSRSKSVLFCGGPALDLSTPVNKSIIDNQAFDSLMHHFQDILKDHADELKSLETGRGANVYQYLKSLMLFKPLQVERETRLMELQDRLKVIGLKKDQTMPAGALKKTFRATGIPVDIEDYPYEYSHENPFPLHDETYQQAGNSLERLIHKTAGFYKE